MPSARKCKSDDSLCLYTLVMAIVKFEANSVYSELIRGIGKPRFYYGSRTMFYRNSASEI
jgi:hypothetical protein